MEMYYEGVRIYVIPEGALCKADEQKRSPEDIDICPLGYEICTGECEKYDEEY